MKEMAKLGELIRNTREMQGVDAKTLAANVGMNPGSLSNLERGLMKNTPDPFTLKSIANELSIPMGRMMTVLGYLEEDADRQADSPAVSTIRAILGDKEFTDKQINQLATIVRSMVEMMEG